MRQIVFDTETTGFDAQGTDRIVEIGAVEVVNFIPTGKTYHQYINPECEVSDGAVAVHGLTYERLKSEPVFAQIGASFMDFIGEADLVAHNAEFDMLFINAEFKRIGMPIIPTSRAIDTLAIARKKFPGANNTLDALCKRFEVDNSERVFHGALLDAQLLAEVYLELSGGRQQGLQLKQASSATLKENQQNIKKTYAVREFAVPESETVAFEEMLTSLENNLWQKRA